MDLINRNFPLTLSNPACQSSTLKTVVTLAYHQLSSSHPFPLPPSRPLLLHPSSQFQPQHLSMSVDTLSSLTPLLPLILSSLNMVLEPPVLAQLSYPQRCQMESYL